MARPSAQRCWAGPGGTLLEPARVGARTCRSAGALPRGRSAPLPRRAAPASGRPPPAPWRRPGSFGDPVGTWRPRPHAAHRRHSPLSAHRPRPHFESAARRSASPDPEGLIRRAGQLPAAGPLPAAAPASGAAQRPPRGLGRRAVVPVLRPRSLLPPARCPPPPPPPWARSTRSTRPSGARRTRVRRRVRFVTAAGEGSGLTSWRKAERLSLPETLPRPPAAPAGAWASASRCQPTRVAAAGQGTE